MVVVNESALRAGKHGCVFPGPGETREVRDPFFLGLGFVRAKGEQDPKVKGCLFLLVLPGTRETGLTLFLARAGSLL